MNLLSWIGPSAMIASVALVYAQNCQFAAYGSGAASENYQNYSSSDSSTVPAKSKFMLSTKMYTIILFFVYVIGVIPPNPFFPKAFFRNNIFRFLYRLYCSEEVGYKYIKNVMHQHNSYMHSDYRSGVRALSGSNFLLRKGPLYELYEDTTKPAAPSHPGERISAAQFSRIQAMKKEEAKQGATGGDTAAASKLLYPTARGDDYIDLTLLTQRRNTREGLLVIPMPIFNDNYSYLLVHLQSRKAVAIDPADLKVLLYFLKRISDYLVSNKGESDGSRTPNVELTEVLVTHKHWDHSGNNRELMEYATSEENKKRYARLHEPAAEAHTQGEDASPVLDCYVSPSLKIYGSAIDAPMAATDLLQDFPNASASAEEGSMPPPLLVADGCVAVDTFFAPGHTKGHVCFVVGDAVTYENGDSQNNKCAVFTGDCLFSGGVGAFFELKSTVDTITVQHLFREKSDGRRGILLHPSTREAMKPQDVYLYAGHEYTERLLLEVKNIIARQKRKPDAESDEASYASADAPAYLESVTKTLEEVVHLRKASDGLAATNTSGSMRLPFCTMPSSLLLERRINPLVTLNPTVLERILAKEKLAGGLENSNEIETAVYCSLNRQLC